MPPTTAPQDAVLLALEALLAAPEKRAPAAQAALTILVTAAREGTFQQAWQAIARAESRN